MVEKRQIEPEVEQALNCVFSGKNFVLTGGAGSGKTYSLISLINEFSTLNKNAPILCITYTNNAVFEIRERSNNENLCVSTIHDFLWSLINQFQTEIIDLLIELINDDEYKIFRLPEGMDKIERSYFDGQVIKYDEYYSINSTSSSISHDHVIILAEKMFAKYKKLCDVLKDNAKLILVDEYQDTAPEVVEILLKHIKKSNKDCVVGFFGDSMQSIYDEGIGEIISDEVEYIFKKQNRRNPLSVITLGNKLRSDGLKQEPSLDNNAPNMVNNKVVEGQALFLYSQKDEESPYRNLEEAKQKHELFSYWDFNHPETKELWLTHNINAEKSGFKNLYMLYDKDPIKELISILKDKTKDKGISLDSNKTFNELCLENIYLFDNRRRGNLYNNVQNDNCEFLNIVGNERWEEVSEQIINSDSLLSYKFDSLTNSYKAKSSRDLILRQLDDLYEIMSLYEVNDINSLLKKTSFNMTTLSSKSALANKLAELNQLIYSNKNIEKVLKFSIDNSIVPLRERFRSFIDGRGFYLWNRIKELSFMEYKNSIEYQKASLPFATQHSIKGSEFDYVLVVLDNGNWNKYNFENAILNRGTESVLNRTQKLLYVCITRAKKELYVYMELDLDSDNGKSILKNAKDLFGNDFVIEI